MCGITTDLVGPEEFEFIARKTISKFGSHHCPELQHFELTDQFAIEGHPSHDSHFGRRLPIPAYFLENLVFLGNGSMRTFKIDIAALVEVTPELLESIGQRWSESLEELYLCPVILRSSLAGLSPGLYFRDLVQFTRQCEGSWT